jgi:signal transduction histidine kinase
MHIKGSQSLLKSAVLNVIDNALKYSPEDKPVDVFLRAEPNALVLEVRDYGYGIEPDELENVFLPFYRSPRTKDIAGHGIGLALTEAVIKNHGGTIEIESEPGKGTTVRVKLNI